jgi:hypothetical protein
VVGNIIRSEFGDIFDSNSVERKDLAFETAVTLSQTEETSAASTDKSSGGWMLICTQTG